MMRLVVGAALSLVSVRALAQNFVVAQGGLLVTNSLTVPMSGEYGSSLVEPRDVQESFQASFGHAMENGLGLSGVRVTSLSYTDHASSHRRMQSETVEIHYIVECGQDGCLGEKTKLDTMTAKQMENIIKAIDQHAYQTGFGSSAVCGGQSKSDCAQSALSNLPPPGVVTIPIPVTKAPTVSSQGTPSPTPKPTAKQSLCVSKNPCFVKSSCADTGDGGASCGDCPSGYSGDGKTCADVDDCAANKNTCGAKGKCADAGTNKLACKCSAGYGLENADAAIQKCILVSACGSDEDDCVSGAKCAHVKGTTKHTCTCPTGYAGDGKTGDGMKGCVDVNGCKDSPCNSLTSCSDIQAPGTGYTCGACPKGYTGDGYKGCTDANDCANNPCSVGSGGRACKDVCSSGMGGSCSAGKQRYACSCLSGFAAFGGSCRKTSVCHSDLGESCPDKSMTCSHDVSVKFRQKYGGFSCNCATGMTKSSDGKKCVDRNDCQKDSCDSLSSCSDVQAPEKGFTCATCPAGYKESWNAGKQVCTDMDDCGANNGVSGKRGPCGVYGSKFTTTKCVNQPGVDYKCRCNTNYKSEYHCDDMSATQFEDFAKKINFDLDKFKGQLCTDNEAGRGLGACNGEDCSLAKITSNQVPNCQTMKSYGLCAKDQFAAVANGFCFATCYGDSNGKTKCQGIKFGCDILVPAAGCKAALKDGLTLATPCQRTCKACGRSCDAINNCASGEDDCSKDATCNHAPGQARHACTCNKGFSGNGKECVDINGCSSNPCSALSQCSDVKAPSTGYTCGSCPSGYVGTGYSNNPCSDIDDCKTSKKCVSPDDSRQLKCVNKPGTAYTCDCGSDYYARNGTCFIKNKCTLDPCVANADCNNDNSGGFTCKCRTGYVGNGLNSCADVNGCEGNPCDKLTTCTDVAAAQDTSGKDYTCSGCPSGYSGSGVQGCSDIDDCVGNPCGAAGKCLNDGAGTGRWKCKCALGYKSVSDSDDITDKDAGFFDSNVGGKVPSGMLKNKNGLVDYAKSGKLMMPASPTGGSSFTCADAGVSNNWNCATAINKGYWFGRSYSPKGPTVALVCRATCGWAGPTCSVVDSCTTSDNKCDSNAECAHLVMHGGVSKGKDHSTDSYTCTCKVKRGFGGDGKRCTDKNACQQAGSVCGTQKFGDVASGKGCCSTLAGGDNACADSTAGDSWSRSAQFSCQNCPSGYSTSFSLKGQSCTDVSDCASSPCGKKSSGCTENGAGTGKYKCTCSKGYTQAAGSDGKDTCILVNHCAADEDDCVDLSTCLSTTSGQKASHTCKCNTGYEGDGTKAGSGCSDINECTDSICYGGGLFSSQQRIAACSDLPPSALPKKTSCASCPKGYTGSGVTCSDADDCAGAPCGKAGGTTCKDIGMLKYKCTCPSGYKESGSADDMKNKCSLQNACVAGEDDCVSGSTCNHVGAGAHTCTCPTGMSGDGTSDGTGCTDINACDAGPCNKLSQCSDIKSPGTGFSCGSCPKGYAGNGVGEDGCKDIDGCANKPCPVLQGAGTRPACTDKAAPQLGFTCDACPTGYDTDAVAQTSGVDICMDTDGCKGNPCNKLSTCIDLKAPKTGFSCVACPSGYSGNAIGEKGCVDVDDCANSPCKNGGTCSDAGANAYTCACPQGYKSLGNSQKPTCQHVNACASGEDDCVTGLAKGAAATCNHDDTSTANNPKHSCTCPKGFEGDGTKSGTGCADIDGCSPNQCATLSGAGTRPACTDKAAPEVGYTCAACPTGYDKTPKKMDSGALVCQDTNACDSTPCSKLVKCADESAPNTGYSCAGCPTGYSGGGPPPPPPPTPAGFHCGFGYHGKPMLVAGSTMDECNKYLAILVKKMGKAAGWCTSKLGAKYTLDGGLVGHMISSQYSCKSNLAALNGVMNGAGGGTWGCTPYKEAYMPADQSRATCEDLALELNKQLGITGYYDESACVDTDGCANSPCATLQRGGTAPKCTDVSAPGTGYQCAPCPTGYNKQAVDVQGSARQMCMDKDGCASAPCDKLTSCKDVDAPGTGFKCSACPSGYSGDGVKGCTDINDCGNAPCGQQQKSCTDTGANSYSCTCTSGYQSFGDAQKPTCQHIDACKSGEDDCVKNVDSDTPPGFHCGFGWHGKPMLAAGSTMDECNKYLAILNKKMGKAAGWCTAKLGVKTTLSGGTVGHMIAAFYNCASNLGAINGVMNGKGGGTWGCTNYKEAYMPADGNRATCATLAKELNKQLGITEKRGVSATCNHDSNSKPNDPKHTCTCPKGYTGDGRKGGSGCTDANGCSPNQCATLEGTSTRLECKDQKAPKTSYTCAACPTGYDSKPVVNQNTKASQCKDSDGCKNSPCSDLVSCTDEKAPKTGFGCGNCPSGYLGNGISKSGCSINYKDDCANTPCGQKLGMSCTDEGVLKYSCSCPPGYRSSGSPLTCNLVNACRADEDDCVSVKSGTVKCNHIGAGRHTCTCPSGYAGDGRKGGTGCVDVDGCAGSKKCPALPSGGKGTAPKCTDKAAPKTGFTCSACPTGYNTVTKTLSGGTKECVDTNACAGNPCDSNTDCTDLKAPSTSYTCSKCPSGFVSSSGDGKTKCTDVNDCTTNACGSKGVSKCTDAGQNKRTCECTSGYASRGDSKLPTCQLVNKCSAGEDDCVIVGGYAAKCNHIGGSSSAQHSCSCPSGYEGDGKSGGTGCSDINACASSPCATLSGAGTAPKCTDKKAPANGYTCEKCPTGYNPQPEKQSNGGLLCIDPDGCANSPCHPLAGCDDAKAPYTGYKCGQCPAGYKGDGVSSNGCAIDYSDDCANDPCGTKSGVSCKDQGILTYSCTCPTGYASLPVNSKKPACLHMDACKSGEDDCVTGLAGGYSAKCVHDPNSPKNKPRHTCSCPKGFIGNGVDKKVKGGNGCTDLDGCLKLKCAKLPGKGKGTAPKCIDDAPPSTGAKCTACPTGYDSTPKKVSWGTGLVCVDTDKCKSNSANCRDNLGASSDVWYSGRQDVKCTDDKAPALTYTCSDCTAGFKHTDYVFLKSGAGCAGNGYSDLADLAECTKAYAEMRLNRKNPTTAIDDEMDKVSYDPKGCYYEGNKLKFNVKKSNTGKCTAADRCLCKADPKKFPQVRRCMDIDDCTTSINKCGKTADGTAHGCLDKEVRTTAKYTCQCRTGYMSAGSNKNQPTCQLIDSCKAEEDDCVALSGTHYTLLSNGQTCASQGYTVLKTMRDCADAATALNLKDITVTDDKEDKATYDPKGCYYEGNNLKFNAKMTNTGICKSQDKCLCAFKRFATCNHKSGSTSGEHTCTCPKGYTGSGKVGCTDRNECKPNPCPTLSGAGTAPTCTDAVAPLTGFTCSACPTGYDTTPVKNVCQDTNGCASKPCDALSSCADLKAPAAGGTCAACPAGYKGNGIKKGRSAQSSGQLMYTSVAKNSYCTSYKSVPGYGIMPPAPSSYGNDYAKWCMETCYKAHKASPTVYGMGFYTRKSDRSCRCAKNTCQSGMVTSNGCCDAYTISFGSCVDDNTKAQSTCKGQCKNLVNMCGKTSGCGGWSGDVASFCPATCGKCAGTGSSKGTGCTDKDDCASNPCGRAANGALHRCKDAGKEAWTCSCRTGYAALGKDQSRRTCKLVNGCTAKEDDCVSNAKCNHDSSATGKHTCSCKSGLQGDGTKSGTGCTEIDGCANSPCAVLQGSGASVKCTDKKAPANGYKCDACPTGYNKKVETIKGKLTCTDMDYCRKGRCDPQQSCSDDKAPKATWTCSKCNQGYKGVSFAAITASKCDTTSGFATITSLKQCAEAAAALARSYSWLQDMTVEVDNQDGKSYDPVGCYYEGGSLKFNMNNGKVGKNTGSCTSNDKCLCAQTKFTRCVDIDDCATSPCGKKAKTCTDLGGGSGQYKCSCQTGYVSAGSPPTCVLVDSCKADEDDCAYISPSQSLKVFAPPQGPMGGCVAAGFKDVSSMAECSKAAFAVTQMNQGGNWLKDLTASDDGQADATWDPKGCYYEGGSLKFNLRGSNKGRCSASDRCLCVTVPIKVKCNHKSDGKKGEHTCTCPTGYVGNGIKTSTKTWDGKNGEGCTDYNACAKNDCPTLDGTSTKVKCTDLKAPSLKFTCAACPTSYDKKVVTTSAGAKICQDSDGCANKPCSKLVSCADVKAPGTGFRCGACPSGYQGNGISSSGCSDINDCAKSPCGTAATKCRDKGTDWYRCTCSAGYSAMPAGSKQATCTLIDACKADEDDCVNNLAGPTKSARCQHTSGTQGGHTCVCPAGYQGDGKKGGTGCTNINGCASHNCATMASGAVGTAPKCVDQQPPYTSYTCTPCPTGFDKQPKVLSNGKKQCKDTEGCAARRGSAKCSPLSKCRDAVAPKTGFLCDDCPSGYKDALTTGISYVLRTSGASCAAMGYLDVKSISECNTASTQLKLSDKTATDDGHKVNRNYDPKGCYFEGSLKFNVAGKNTGKCRGSDKCICKSYTGRSCLDIDDCANSPCGTKVGTSCQDTGANLYKCTCPSGYTSSGTTCALKNECSAAEDDCVSIGKTASYFKQTSGYCDEYVESAADCNIAAAFIGFSDRTATDDGNNGANYDPKGCYYEDGSLKFNKRKTNTGACKSNDHCLCKRTKAKCNHIAGDANGKKPDHTCTCPKGMVGDGKDSSKVQGATGCADFNACKAKPCATVNNGQGTQVKCTDLKAPSMDRKCGPCPSGYEPKPKFVNGKEVCVTYDACATQKCAVGSVCSDLAAPSMARKCGACPAGKYGTGYPASCRGTKKNGDSSFCSTNCKCGHGEGDCTADNQCNTGLVCGQQNVLVNKGGSGCTSSKQCGACEGDCDRDSDCKTGYMCFQRNNKAKVPTCFSGGDGDKNAYDFCVAKKRKCAHQTVKLVSYSVKTTGTCNGLASYITSAADCAAAAKKLVAGGASWIKDLTVSNDNQANVGYDPKGCYYEDGSLKFNFKESSGNKCADEGGRCSCTGKVRYGHGTSWATKQSSGAIQCTNGVFGDPKRGTRKACFCVSCADDDNKAQGTCKGQCKHLANMCGKTSSCGGWSGDVASFCPQTCGKCGTVNTNRGSCKSSDKCLCKQQAYKDPSTYDKPAGCTDVNDCSKTPCSPTGTTLQGAICKDTGASMYTCTCPRGYKSVGQKNSPKCAQVDVCKSGEDDCVTGAKCNHDSNSPSDKPRHTCTCPSGKTGNGKKSGSGCTEIDGCKPAPCATLPSGGYGTAPTCTDKKSPQTGATCSNCPAGYNAQPTKPSYGGRGVCTDKNDCSSNPCGPAFAKCDEGRAGTGLYTCKCTTNFVSSNNKQGFPYCFVDPKIPGDILKANGAANPSCTSSFSDKALVDELIKLCPKCGIKKL